MILRVDYYDFSYVAIHNVLIRVLTLVIHDNDVHSSETGSPCTSALPRVRSQLPRRSHFPADSGLQRHTNQRILHGSGTQPCHLDIRSALDRVFLVIFRLHIPKIHPFHKIAFSKAQEFSLFIPTILASIENVK
jgi:hypothetical protein